MAIAPFPFDSKVDFRYGGNRVIPRDSEVWAILDTIEDEDWEKYLDLHAAQWVTVEYDLSSDVFRVKSCITA